MIYKSAIIKIRKHLGIRVKGYSLESKALAWYKKHYFQATGKAFNGSFGFRYSRISGYVDFKYEIGKDFIKVYSVHPLDNIVPLDREAMKLATDTKIPDWAAPCLRIILLVGKPTDTMEPRFPDHLLAPLGSVRLLVHPAKKMSLGKWRKTGMLMGLLPGEIDLWKVPAPATTYSPKRENTMEILYWQTYQAYRKAIKNRRSMGVKGKKGLLVDTANILVEDYSWKIIEKSYTIRRFLDRAEKMWHIPTHPREQGQIIS